MGMCPCRGRSALFSFADIKLFECADADDMWKFDVHLHVWRKIVFSDDVDTPAARFLHGAAQMDGSDNMYIFGGQLSTEVTLDTPEDKELRANDVWVFNFGETQWTRLFASTCLARGQ